MPQLKLSCDNGLLLPQEIPSENILLHICENLFANIQPTLLHGDLWSEDFLISKNGSPYLLDASV